MPSLWLFILCDFHLWSLWENPQYCSFHHENHCAKSFICDIHFRPIKYEQFNQLLILTWQQIRYAEHIYIYPDVGIPETHTKRDRRPSTAACPSCWAMGQMHWNSVWWEKKYFALGRIEQTKAGQKSLAPALQAQPTSQGRTPFICTLWVPITLFSTVSRGHLFLITLRNTE